jgi:hypothetical protein
MFGHRHPPVGDSLIASRSITRGFLIESAPQCGEQLRSQLFRSKVYSSDVSAAGIQETEPIQSNCHPGHKVTICGELELGARFMRCSLLG